MKGFIYNFPKHRELFHKLKKYMDKRQIIAIIGLRRVGKTVLMWQLINWLINEKHIKRTHILYFTYDKNKISIKELLENYSQITGIDYKSKKIFVFLDEIQKLENWQEEIKFYYDLYPNIKFVVSGSSSLFLKATESLAGRIFEFYLPILNFKEFLLFKNIEIKNIEIYKEEITKLINEYLKKQFIEIIDEDEETYKMYYESIVNKVIFEDIPKQFPIENPSKLKSLFMLIATNPGMYLNYESLASDLSLNRKTIEKYIDYLEKANLIFKVYNFSKNLATSEKKIKRAYLTAPCFSFLYEFPNIEKVIENIVVLSLNTKYFYRDPQKKEIDAIVKKDKTIIPVEVKYKQHIKKKEIKSLLSFLKKYKGKKGVVITRNIEKEELYEWFNTTKTIQFIPFWKWLMEKEKHL